MVEMTYVDSSNIDQIGYDPDTMELHVIFRDGGAHYIYRDVPQVIFDELGQAPSKGSFLNREVKGAFDYTKM